jgi:hypothetical protein
VNYYDASTTSQISMPDMSSNCANCRKPAQAHIDGKCPFEASEYKASQYSLPFVPAMPERLTFGLSIPHLPWHE